MSGLNLTWMFLVHYFASNLIDAKAAMMFNRSVLGQEDKSCKEDHNKFLGLKFQIKLFFYKYLFCKKKKFINVFSEKD